MMNVAFNTPEAPALRRIKASQIALQILDDPDIRAAIARRREAQISRRSIENVACLGVFR